MSLNLRQVIRHSSLNAFLRRPLSVARLGHRRFFAGLPLLARTWLVRDGIALERSQDNRCHGTLATETNIDIDTSVTRLGSALTSCPGCGALAQTVEPGAAGHYTTKRKTVSPFLHKDQEKHACTSSAVEAQVFARAVENASTVGMEALRLAGVVQTGTKDSCSSNNTN